MRLKIPSRKDWWPLASAAWKNWRRPTKSALTFLMALSPLLPLGLSIRKNPAFIQTSNASSALSGGKLLRKCPQTTECSFYLGTLKTHRIYVSLDNISDSDYLSFVPNPPHTGGNALAISIVDTGESWGGVLLDHVLDKLEAASPGDRDRIIDLLIRAQSSPNEVMTYNIRSTRPQTPTSFPVQHLFLTKLGEQGKKAYQGEIRELLNLASQDEISNLIVPCLGRNPRAKTGDWHSCADTYADVFRALGTNRSPRRIYLSLYNQWPTETIEQATRSLNDAWSTALIEQQRKSGPLPIIYEGSLRPMLLALLICLLVCWFRRGLAAKSFTIICVLFGASAWGLLHEAPKLLSAAGLGLASSWAIMTPLLMILGAYVLITEGRLAHDN